MRDVDALVAELRERAASYRLGGPSSEHTAVLLDKAADALESERSRADRLEKALEPFARAVDEAERAASCYIQALNSGDIGQ